jgi:hypothetical protein
MQIPVTIPVEVEFFLYKGIIHAAVAATLRWSNAETCLGTHVNDSVGKKAVAGANIKHAAL